MRSRLVAGNWKMNGSRDMATELLSAIGSGVSQLTGVEVVVCPPFVLISQAITMLADSGVAVGGQDLDPNMSGAFTGQINAGLLLDQGCRYAIVGHSERRTLYGEGDEWVAQKALAAQSAGLSPIVCVGETLEEREAGRTESVIQRQLEAVIHHGGVALLAEAVVAYEPVWAIGTGETATPEQADAVHEFIRHRVASQSGTIADQLLILYGGSVKADNAPALFQKEHIDGGLIGGAALSAQDFLKICSAAVR